VRIGARIGNVKSKCLPMNCVECACVRTSVGQSSRDPELLSRGSQVRVQILPGATCSLRERFGFVLSNMFAKVFSLRFGKNSEGHRQTFVWSTRGVVAP